MISRVRAAGESHLPAVHTPRPHPSCSFRLGPWVSGKGPMVIPTALATAGPEAQSYRDLYPGRRKEDSWQREEHLPEELEGHQAGREDRK